MKLSSVLVNAILVATAVAAPTAKTSRHAQRVARRALKSPDKAPSLFRKGNGTTEATKMGQSTSAQASFNWAGAVITEPPSGEYFETAVGTFNAPTPSAPSGGSSRDEYAGAAWVGIDGDTCQTAIIQAGIDWYYEDGQVGYDAWYEWYPDYSYDFNDITINTGDSIKVTITATSDTAGKVTVDNLSSGQSVSESFSGEGNALCRTNAEWIVEDFEEDDELVDFADFGTVTFTDVSVTTNKGTSEGLEAATLIYIESETTYQTLTDEEIVSDSELTVTYI